MEHVILVNPSDKQIGTMEKMEAHRKGKLHRAFSVFIFNDKQELLLQRRAISKYHSGGLWTNTCCSHPREGETILDAANRRLQEEMGFETKLDEQFSFIYRAELDNGLIEHELDHVVFGFYNSPPTLNLEEACEWKYLSMESIENDIEQNSDHYTEWFKIIFKNVKSRILH